uniref:Uncharacterized protein n=1 Tax=Pipistrellus kuhlii TaxID=59472 RepID=A0A7J7S0T9_PIPKU|nr:hypothetical protein mPipKuh1_010195 [Pipistrellus kuhlii]
MFNFTGICRTVFGKGCTIFAGPPATGEVGGRGRGVHASQGAVLTELSGLNSRQGGTLSLLPEASSSTSKLQEFRRKVDGTWGAPQGLSHICYRLLGMAKGISPNLKGMVACCQTAQGILIDMLLPPTGQTPEQPQALA